MLFIYLYICPSCRYCSLNNFHIEMLFLFFKNWCFKWFLKWFVWHFDISTQLTDLIANSIFTVGCDFLGNNLAQKFLQKLSRGRGFRVMVTIFPSKDFFSVKKGLTVVAFTAFPSLAPTSVSQAASSIIIEESNQLASSFEPYFLIFSWNANL